ncbi:hypothetical protein KV699_08535 [Vreelandella titanicae]|uniref:hypothetical protein n=1 Tax=Vreelandella titanicae TaxID=664683 RepID=UPI003BAEB9CE
MEFIVVGVQRTGTNYCTEILKSLNKKNECDIIETGDRQYLWKHALPNESGPNYSKKFNTPLDAVLNNDLSIVLIHKNPLWWLSSIINRNSADLSRQRPFVYNDKVLDIKKALFFYADFYLQWLDLVPERKVTHVSYHEILNDCTSFSSKLNEKYGLSFNASIDLHSLSVPYSKGDYESRRRIYNNEQYDLEDDVLRECYDSLTPDLKFVFQKLGYFF